MSYKWARYLFLVALVAGWHFYTTPCPRGSNLQPFPTPKKRETAGKSKALKGPSCLRASQELVRCQPGKGGTPNNIFQLGWNHQLGNCAIYFYTGCDGYYSLWLRLVVLLMLQKSGYITPVEVGSWNPMFYRVWNTSKRWLGMGFLNHQQYWRNGGQRCDARWQWHLFCRNGGHLHQKRLVLYFLTQ